MDRPNRTVSSKAKDSFSQFWETSFVSKNTVHISKGISIPWIKGKIWVVLQPRAQEASAKATTAPSFFDFLKNLGE